jgi:hypothetical protein
MDSMRGRRVAILVLCAACGAGVRGPQRLGQVPEQLGRHHVRGFAVGEHGVFLAESDGRIARVSSSVAEPVVLAIGQSPWSVAVDRSHVYWANDGGAVRRVAVAGGGVEEIGRMVGPGPMVIDDRAIYWVDDGRLMRVDKIDLAPIPLAIAHAVGGALALDTTSVYWVDDCAGAVLRVDKAGGAPTALARLETNPSGCKERRFGLEDCGYICSVVAVDETHVYWVESDRVMRVSKRGGPSEVVVSGQPSPNSVAVDDETIYFTTRGERMIYHYHHDDAPADDRTVRSVHKRDLGAAPRTLATSLGEYGHPSGVTVGGDRIYWRDGTACAIDKPSTSKRP